MPFRWTSRENHLSAYGAEVRRAAADIVGKAVLDIHARTAAASPVKYGRLKTGWQPIMPEPSGPVLGGVGTNVEYAAYQELGTGAAGAGSPYPFPRTARYTMSWAGLEARAMLGNAAAFVLPKAAQALGMLGDRMRQL